MPMLRMLNAGTLSELLFAYWEIADDLCVAINELMETDAVVAAARSNEGAKVEKFESAEWKHKIMVEKALAGNDAYTNFLGAQALAQRTYAVLEIEKKAADSVMSFLKAAMVNGEIPIDELLEMMGKPEQDQNTADGVEQSAPETEKLEAEAEPVSPLEVATTEESDETDLMDL